MKKHIAFLPKRNHPEAIRLTVELVSALEKHFPASACYVAGDTDPLPESLRAKKWPQAMPALDLLVVLGGDGTLLYGAALTAAHNVPILGINVGHLGFLSAGPKEEAWLLLQAAMANQLPVEQRSRLRCTVGTRHFWALNEVVFSQAVQQARLLELEAELDGQWITTYRSDGLIVATPTGSTAYNLAAGGPIVAPAVQGLVLTPICPHTLTVRPIVVPHTAHIVISAAQKSERVALTLDGRTLVELDPGQRAEVAIDPQPLSLLRARGYSFFDVLRHKLHWGAREDR